MTSPRRTPRVAALAGLLAAAALLPGFRQDAAPEREPLRFQPAVVVEFKVTDLDRSVRFYRDVLGLELVSRSEQLAWATFRTALPGLTLGLGESEDTAGSGTASLNLGVADADRARALLEERGVTFFGDTTNIPGVVRLADFEDPDGNLIRLAGPPR